MAGTPTRAPITVTPPTGGFDRAGMRELVRSTQLASRIHALVKGPFGHTALTLQALDATVEAADLALQAGEAMHAALLEDIAASGSLAIPEPTADQRAFIGAFVVTVLADALCEVLAELAPVPASDSDLEAEGLEGLLEAPVKDVITRLLGMTGRYVEVQAKRQPESGDPKLPAREAWVVTTIHAFLLQLRGAVEKLTHGGRLRPFGVALAKRKVTVGDRRYEGFRARAVADPVTDLKPVKVDDIVGNTEYVEAALKLCRDVAAYDLEAGRSAKRINPVLFALGRPGCGKTITAHAIGNYFLDYCRERDIPAKFRVIRRTDWASSYQNASASSLIKIFEEEVYGFEGVCGVYWADIDTAFASRSSGDLRMEEKNNLGAVFGIFDGTLIPKDGKWFMMCDANFMQMDEATTSRIAQNPFRVRGPTTSEDYVRLLRDVLLRGENGYIDATDAQWGEIGSLCVEADLSGRSMESVAGNIRAKIQDFEYPDHYFSADFAARSKLLEELSVRVSADKVTAEVRDYVRFHKEADEAAETDRFEREVSDMVQRLNAGRAAAQRLAEQGIAVDDD
ncbi:MAG: AAA family ATPase [Myxococcota bacterium]